MFSLLGLQSNTFPQFLETPMNTFLKNRQKVQFSKKTYERKLLPYAKELFVLLTMPATVQFHCKANGVFWYLKGYYNAQNYA